MDVNGILSNREIQTVENCIRNVYADLRLFLSFFLSFIIQLFFAAVFNISHILKKKY